ncbi:MAG: hypothetical protein HN478_13340 [Rhodospirillaceae bacterium]|jgi:hypothetical protein|nr:hypothetical protein [Rhodospirillaceae bacterium]MBT4489654.1 hypothetical protein [Rhodospirillaceae bacterium]MBT5190770.1 hypothetical protein [Rhodospirillaceae bacterium]MBT5897353.1 hypothetical protein [Rhodospirillaceae bacterium]MBT6430314.1 hypothetical protein [Rhodospirillaceae bacterium]
MMCEPSEADLVFCAQRGIAAAREAGETKADGLRSWALREVRAAWPHVEPEAMQAAVSRYLK